MHRFPGERIMNCGILATVAPDLFRNPAFALEVSGGFELFVS
jgi:hypothetical protein